MTGHQPNPASGRNIHGEPAPQIDLEALCRACGAQFVRTVDAFDLKGLETAIKEETERDALSVIIARRPCVLLNKKEKKFPYRVAADRCKGCLSCMKLSCPAIEKEGRVVKIDPIQCVGCALCLQTCKFGAIERMGE